MNEERIKEVFSDEEFVKELFSKETPEEAQAMLAEKDIDLTVEELIQLRELIIKKAQQTDDNEELVDDDLEDVAGGSVILLSIAVYGIAALGVAAIIHVFSKGRW